MPEGETVEREIAWEGDGFDRYISLDNLKPVDGYNKDTYVLKIDLRFAMIGTVLQQVYFEILSNNLEIAEGEIPT